MLKTTALILLCCALGRADIAAVKAEPNLERRSQLALEEAENGITAAKKSYDEGRLAEFRAAVGEVGDLAELSYTSLDQTGKRARRSPKWFKRAEQRLLVVIRRLDSLEKDVSLDDRPLVTSVKKRVSDVHDNILHDIMTRK
jgi:hypothetical protein